ncbi:unnamed protein product [Brugia pahangi]|uniref:Uncharacterized protein n=1 Tax=Brugia pahangi TaxID=6280 RepID=A0A0N4T7P0_BRUPA|nr:unnamed protein product [Brugia pahangi]
MMMIDVDNNDNNNDNDNNKKYFLIQILLNGRNAIEMPTELIEVQCLPAPKNGIKHGIRIRILCNLKLNYTLTCNIRDPEKYHWITIL